MAKISDYKDNFVFHEDWINTMNAFGLSDAQFRAVICTAVEYNRSAHVPTDDELDAVCRKVFDTMRSQMDDDAARYALRRAEQNRGAKT